MADGVGTPAVAAIGSLDYFVFYHGRQGTLTTSMEPPPVSLRENLDITTPGGKLVCHPGSITFSARRAIIGGGV